MTCTPQELARAAACLRCLPDGMIRNVRTSLLCQWANLETNPCGPEKDCIQVTSNPANPLQPQSGSYIFTLGVGWIDGMGIPQTSDGWLSPNGQWLIDFFGGEWGIYTLPFHHRFFVLSTGEPFPCGIWIGDPIFHAGLTGPTMQYATCISNIILDDGTGTFWQVIVNTDGLLGTQDSVGPATGPWILNDGVGGFWQMVVAIGGLLGTTSTVGPATAPVPALSDGTVTWTIIVDGAGNLGATS